MLVLILASPAPMASTQKPQPTGPPAAYPANPASILSWDLGSAHCALRARTATSQMLRLASPVPQAPSLMLAQPRAARSWHVTPASKGSEIPSPVSLYQISALVCPRLA